MTMTLRNEILKREKAAIAGFFEKDILVPKIPKWINDGIIQFWEKNLFDLHYLPDISLTENRDLSLWQDRPSKTFYQKIKEGKLSKKSSNLGGKWILIDSRDKPAKKVPWITSKDISFLKIFGLTPALYLKRMGKQQFNKEYLLDELSEIDCGSRFCLTINNIENLKPAILRFLNINGKVVRLPRFIEYNYLGNVYYPQWETTETWEWFEDIYDKDQHLAGGSKSAGIIGWEPDNFWSTILTFRPLIEV